MASGSSSEREKETPKWNLRREGDARHERSLDASRLSRGPMQGRDFVVSPNRFTQHGRSGIRRFPVSELRIPFNRASVVGRELDHVAEAARSGAIAGDHSFTDRCHELFESTLGTRRALLTTSCTHALEMAALMLDLTAGDEVIVPSFTFVSTANAFALRGARIVFADIRPDTLNLDEARLEDLVTARTRAIVPVHYAGVGCEMDAILDLASRRGIAVVEDNAHGLFGKYRGRWLGTFGVLGTQSFHETKNFVCGEGGALLINDDEYVDRAEIVREKGTDRSRFFRGEVDKYGWVDLGSSYLLSDLLAAFLWGQLSERERIQERRRQLWLRYHAELAVWAAAADARRPTVPEHCEQSWHCYYLVLPTPEARAGLARHLRERGIQAVGHYLPLHLSPMGRRFGGREGDCEVTETVSDRLLRLPLFYELGDDEQREVIEAVACFRP
jgi:dTDP-4-amino-4,6-dideoxygalactose transaminase